MNWRLGDGGPLPRQERRRNRLWVMAVQTFMDSGDVPLVEAGNEPADKRVVRLEKRDVCVDFNDLEFKMDRIDKEETKNYLLE